MNQALINNYAALVLKNISYKIVILIKSGQVIMHSTFNTDQGDLLGVDLLKGNTVSDRNKPVPGTMNDVSMTLYFG